MHTYLSLLSKLLKAIFLFVFIFYLYESAINVRGKNNNNLICKKIKVNGKTTFAEKYFQLL